MISKRNKMSSHNNALGKFLRRPLGIKYSHKPHKYINGIHIKNILKVLGYARKRASLLISRYINI